MSSWAAIPVLSGFRYDGRAHGLTLAPRLPARPFRSFWSAPCAWGSFELAPQSLALTVAAGSCPLKELSLSPFHPAALGSLKVTCGDQPVAHSVHPDGNGLRLAFSAELRVDPGHPLRVRG